MRRRDPEVNTDTHYEVFNGMFTWDYESWELDRARGHYSNCRHIKSARLEEITTQTTTVEVGRKEIGTSPEMGASPSASWSDSWKMK